jgi:hypothetical protein
LVVELVFVVDVEIDGVHDAQNLFGEFNGGGRNGLKHRIMLFLQSLVESELAITQEEHQEEESNEKDKRNCDLDKDVEILLSVHILELLDLLDLILFLFLVDLLLLVLFHILLRLEVDFVDERSAGILDPLDGSLLQREEEHIDAKEDLL